MNHMSILNADKTLLANKPIFEVRRVNWNVAA